MENTMIFKTLLYFAVLVKYSLSEFLEAKVIKHGGYNITVPFSPYMFEPDNCLQVLKKSQTGQQNDNLWNVNTPKSPHCYPVCETLGAGLCIPGYQSTDIGLSWGDTCSFNSYYSISEYSMTSYCCTAKDCVWSECLPDKVLNNLLNLTLEACKEPDCRVSHSSLSLKGSENSESIAQLINSEKLINLSGLGNLGGLGNLNGLGNLGGSEESYEFAPLPGNDYLRVENLKKILACNPTGENPIAAASALPQSWTNREGTVVAQKVDCQGHLGSGFRYLCCQTSNFESQFTLELTATEHKQMMAKSVRFYPHDNIAYDVTKETCSRLVNRYSSTCSVRPSSIPTECIRKEAEELGLKTKNPFYSETKNECSGNCGCYTCGDGYRCENGECVYGLDKLRPIECAHIKGVWTCANGRL